jgi:ATP/maltotriose-dependent transcriptional regulator MalT
VSTALGGGPRLPRVYIPRPRLWEQLDRATEGALTLLVAPGGAGKTLGVGGWVTVTSAPYAVGATWIQGDHRGASSQLARALDEGAASEGAGSGVEPPLVIVDDAQALPAATLRVLDQRLEHAPESMRVLLLSRWDLPLSRLVHELLGNVTVLRGEVLRLTDDEAAQLVTEHARTDDPEVVRIVSERAQGWCAAVVLAARTVGAARDPVAAAAELERPGAAVADRVASEVFATLGERQRHLLLCVAGEGVVSATTAAHLAGDPGAGDVLAELETAGFLVTRVPHPPGPAPLVPDDVSYRIHPLLVEVIRRRLVAGGDDVERARSDVVSAVRLDVTRDRLDDGLARLLAVGAEQEVADLLGRHGVRLVLTRRSRPELADVARSHPRLVDTHPELWFPLALERWLVGDVDAARHWGERVLGRQAVDPDLGDPVAPSHVAIVRLWRAMLGLEPAYAAAGFAKRVVMAQRQEPALDGPDSVHALLLHELGVAQSWLGDLAEAGANLTLAVGQSRNRGLQELATDGLAHLALTEYVAGREHACVELASEALAPGTDPAAGPRFATHRAALARLLGELVDLPTPADPTRRSEPGQRVHRADLSLQFWARLLDARLELMAGSAAGAEQVLEAPGEHAELAEVNLPDHLRAAVLVERAFLAALSSDGRSLLALSAELRSLQARGEAALVDGLRADLDGERRRAAACFESAAADAVYSQPPSRAIALACQAQMLDALGEPEAALACLRVATTETEVRRNAVPFLGWTRQGTPIRALLARLAGTMRSAWLRELVDALAEHQDVMTSYRSTTATPRERETAAHSVVRPQLSPREREVLGELARGATYADIATSLFVSENTVKTHVSSLYGKLAVSRRSEALAVARGLNLL